MERSARDESRPVAAWSWLDHAVVVAGLGEAGRTHALTGDLGGDLAFALAIAGASAVTHATDSLASHALVELKLAAARALPLEGYRCLLGLDPAGRRVFFYHLIRAELSEPCRAWWDAHEDLIRLGVATCGIWERHLEGYRLRVLPLVHRRSTLEEALKISDPEVGRTFFADRWDSLAWRAATRAWFGSAVHRALGLPTLKDGWMERMITGAGISPPSRSFLARFALTGQVDDLEVAWPQVSTWGHQALRAAARRIRLVHRSPAAELEAEERGTYSALALGVVAPDDPTLSLAGRRLRPGGRIMAWIAGEPLDGPPGVVREPALEAELRRMDRSAALGPLLVARAQP